MTSYPGLFMTIPTAGTRHDLLTKLVEDSGLPRDRIVIVSTRSGIRVPEGCLVVEDLGSVNIHRWWNAGIDAAVERGATAVAVSNDDVAIRSSTLPALYEALRTSGATIASPSRQGLRRGLHRRRLVPYSAVLWGCLWMVDPQAGLRPDTRYSWWYGDNDLDIRARRDFSGIVSVDCYFRHELPGEHTGVSDELRQLAEVDQRTYETDHGRLLWRSHWASKIKRMSPRSTTPTETHP